MATGAPPPRAFPADGVDVALRDGGVVHIREVTSDDVGPLTALLHALDPDERRLRYFTAGVNVERMARYAAEVEERDGAGLVAEGDGVLLGHAEFIRIDGETAEVAFETAPAAQGRGLATVLLAHLAQMAHQVGHHDVHRVGPPREPPHDRRVPCERVRGDRAYAPRRARPRVPVRDDARGARPLRGARAARRRRGVRGLLAPASIALVGASNRPGSVGAMLWGNLVDGGFTGALHPVNRHGGDARRLPVVALRARVDPIPELAIVACRRMPCSTSSTSAPRPGSPACSSCRPGSPRAMLAAPRARTSSCTAAAPRGSGSSARTRSASSTPTRDRAERQRHAGRTRTRRARRALAERRAWASPSWSARAPGRLGLSTFVSVGNKADVSGNDVLQYWEGDPRTDVALLYLQSFGNPRKFARIARRMGRTKPILAVKGGRTPPRVDAEASSTGALLAGSDITVDTLCRQVGVIRAGSLDEVLDVAKLLDDTHLPAGPRVAIVTNSRGPALVCADACADSGLEVPPLEDGTRERLLRHVAEGAGAENPVDLFASAGPREIRHAVAVLADSEEIDAVIAIVSPSLAANAVDAAQAIAAGAADAGGDMPIIAAFPAAAAPPDELHAGPARIASFTFPESAARALGRATRYAQWRARPVEPPATVHADADVASAVIARALGAGGGWLAPGDAERLCTAYGLPLAPGVVADTPEDATRAAERIGFPVALKAVAGDAADRMPTSPSSRSAWTRRPASWPPPPGSRPAPRRRASEHTRLLVQRMVPAGRADARRRRRRPAVRAAAGVRRRAASRPSSSATSRSGSRRSRAPTCTRWSVSCARTPGWTATAARRSPTPPPSRTCSSASARWPTRTPRSRSWTATPSSSAASGAAIVDVRIRVAPARPVAPLPSVGGA